jgi:hypothetical protein
MRTPAVGAAFADPFPASTSDLVPHRDRYLLTGTV